MSVVKISDRTGKTIREHLLDSLQENFWRLSKHPMLRLIGMEREEAAAKKEGSPLRPRVMIPTVAAGRRFEVEHLHTPFGGGVHAAAEDTTLRSGKFQSNRSYADAKFIQGSFLITRQAIAATRDKKFALVKEISQNSMGAVHSIHANLNRMFVGPTNGQLCVVNDAVSAATTVNVDNGGTEETPPVQHLNIGDQLLVGTTAEIEAGTAESATVSTITDDNTFETTTNETFADNDIITRADVYAGGAYQEVTGLPTLVNNTGTVQNINKATSGWFASHVTAMGGSVTLNAINSLLMKCRRYTQTPGDLFMVMNSVQWRRIASLYTAVTQNAAPDSWSGNLVGGYTGLVHYSPDGKIPLFIDDMVEDGKLYILDPNAFMWAEMAPFDFAEDSLAMDGVPGQRQSGTLNYEFAFFLFGNLVQVNAKSCGVITGITGPAVG